MTEQRQDAGRAATQAVRSANSTAKAVNRQAGVSSRQTLADARRFSENAMQEITGKKAQ